MFILKNQFQNSSFSQYCDSGTDHIRVIDALLDRAKIIKNEIFRHDSFLELLGGSKVN